MGKKKRLSTRKRQNRLSPSHAASEHQRNVEALAKNMESMMHSPPIYTTDRTHPRPADRMETIRRFNEKADLLSEQGKTMSHFATSFNFVQKAQKKRPADWQNLEPIGIAELTVGTTHRKRVVYCTVVTRLVQMKSAAVLVEDRTGITELAVYGMSKPKEMLKENRPIAIIEPFFKIRHDGTEGIRVDDPIDIIFDAGPCPSALTSIRDHPAEKEQQEPVSVRVSEIIDEEGSKSTEDLFMRLVGEGYSVTMRQVKAMVVASRENKLKGWIPIISERIPRKHQRYTTLGVTSRRETGNSAYQCGDFVQAEKMYSAALKEASSDQGVHDGRPVTRWELYSNRCAARLKLGKLTDALDDALAANICAPENELKPLFRCLDCFSHMGLFEEAMDLITSMNDCFPNEKCLIDEKRQQISPQKILHVGPDKEHKTISAALLVAPRNAEILVAPGKYHESIVLLQPVSLRCASHVEDGLAMEVPGDGCEESNMVVLIAHGNDVVVTEFNPDEGSVSIVGFRIRGTGANWRSFHSLFTCSGTVVLKNCSLTNTSGPVVSAAGHSTRLFLIGCKIHDGAQGGILARNGSSVTVRDSHCCRNAACGIESREGASTVVTTSFVYGNGRQGVIVWHSSGDCLFERCSIHSHGNESGVLVSEGRATLRKCHVYGNDKAGVVVQEKGSIDLDQCKVHDNMEGILIQHTGTARVTNCEAFGNRSNGIFVGFDHVGYAELIDNVAHDNISEGICIRNEGKKLTASGNKEYGNKHLPPVLSSKDRARSSTEHQHLRLLRKNRETIAAAMSSDPLIQSCGRDPTVYADAIIRMQERKLTNCAFCHESPPTGESFHKCAKCKIVVYCSRKCQRMDWAAGHKQECSPDPVKHAQFLDNQKSV